MIKLVPVAAVPDSIEFLYELLKERKPEQNISHKQMPTFEEHQHFVLSEPYLGWYLIYSDELDAFVGSIYITQAREVGLFITEKMKGKGFGKAALKLLQNMYPGPLLANVSLRNAPSAVFFTKQGFDPIQLTFRREG